MRHGKRINHLSRTSAHRKAMLANMACSLIQHKRINTTVAKAKELRKFVEPIINRSKTDSTHSRRQVFRYLQNKDIVSELFRDVAPKVAEREGGYTRILKTGTRLGDNADMCLIELVDFNELYVTDKKEKKSSRRRRRGGKTSGTAPEASSQEATKAEDMVIEDAVVEETTENQKAPVPEAKEESKAETTKEEPKAEAAKEEPKATKEEPKAEIVKEEPEAAKEEPTAEAVEEAPSEDKKEEPKAEDKVDDVEVKAANDKGEENKEETDNKAGKE